MRGTLSRLGIGGGRTGDECLRRAQTGVEGGRRDGVDLDAVVGLTVEGRRGEGSGRV